MKKHFSILLAAVIIILSLPIGIFSLTANAEVVSGTCGENLTWTFDTDTWVLTISGDGEMENYWNNRDVPWYDYESRITGVVFDGKITSIGNNAFYDCSILISITIPNGVTSIGKYAFENCSRLTSITISNSVTSIGETAFARCSSLTSITIPNSVTSIGGGAFYNCKNLASITLPDSVTSIGVGAFAGTAYYNAESNWKNGVLYIGNHLIAAKREILTGNYAISEGTVYVAESAFYYCSGLTSITIPDSVKVIDTYAFCYCYGLASVYISKTDRLYIEAYAFSDCFGLKDVYYGGSEAESKNINIVTYVEVDEDSFDSGITNEKLSNATWHYAESTSVDPNLGDLNGDGKITSRDYGMLKRFCLGTYDMSEEEKAFADINGDGKINSRDYGLLKRHCLGTYNIFE